METKAETQQELFDFAFVMKILSICNLLPLREFIHHHHSHTLAHK